MPTAEHVILRELLAHEPNWVSGAALAARLGVSRVAIWQHMEKLRAAGFMFEAQRARGYRIKERPPALYGALIETQLKVRPRNFSLLVLDQVDSTNDEAARELAAGRPTPFAILSRRQTHGRGRFGRAWHSASTANLYISFAFRPRVEPQRMQTFTLWMGVNVCELLANFTSTRPGIKWPNDILFDGRKAGGMLTEARVDSDQIRDLIFGLGLNVNSTADQWPADLARRAIALSEVTGAPLDLNRLAAALIGRVLLAWQKFADGEHNETFADLWNHYDLLRGKPVTLLEGGHRHRGTVTGLDDEGALLLRDETGRAQRFRAGEVTLEKGSETRDQRPVTKDHKPKE
ncbi:MAG: biotin--[acetyl-CoA-carboxylase] ligase [Opitutaceae bacterium]|nr:biotin--[acetyl-CoA-carboxylase] ligase [Opitutaceae bacterium]